MRYRFIKLVGGTAAVAVAGLGCLSILGRDCEALCEPPIPCGLPWDHNWDRRAVESSVRPPRKSSDLESYEKSLVEKQPTAVRNLILVRHGSYHQKSTHKSLNELGREQANLVGKYLQSLDLPVSKIISSSKPRATETGAIISSYFKGVATESCKLLEEGHPELKPEPATSVCWEPPVYVRHVESVRMEAAFRKYFHRASPKQTEDSYEILSCHGNVIRYCVLRALQLPPQAHLNLEAYNGSVTWLQIAPNGRVNLLQFGDTGFLPPDKLTLYGPQCTVVH